MPVALPVDALRSVGPARAGLLGIAPALALVLELAGCADQPKPYCISTVSPFAVKLIERSRAGACDAFGPASFNADPEVGLSPFYARNRKGQPNYSAGSLGIQTSELGALNYEARDYGVTNAATDGELYSRGDFSEARPDADDFCTVPALSLTHLVLAEIPATEDDPATQDADEAFAGRSAVDVSLNWSNLRVSVTAASFGTQMDADLVDSRISPTGDRCEIRYKALGLAPAVPCAALDEDGAAITNGDGSVQLDPSACDPEADPAAGRLTGSGISPNAAFTCDPVTAYCMLEGDVIPSLR